MYVRMSITIFMQRTNLVILPVTQSLNIYAIWFCIPLICKQSTHHQPTFFALLSESRFFYSREACLCTLCTQVYSLSMHKWIHLFMHIMYVAIIHAHAHVFSMHMYNTCTCPLHHSGFHTLWASGPAPLLQPVPVSGPGPLLRWQDNYSNRMEQ